MKSFLLTLIAVFLITLDSHAQCTITGTTVNAGSLSCSSFSGCSIVYIGNGTNPTSVNMNADLNLSCLGAIQLVVRNNASIDFSPGNNRLTLAEGSSIIINTGGSLVGGSCNASERIYIGTNLLATCNGGAGAGYSFTQLMTFGGTGSLASNSPVCNGSNINLSATPPPNGTYSYSFSGNGLPGEGTTYSSNPTYSVAATSAGSFNYQVMMKSSLAGNPVILAEITVTVNAKPNTPTATLTQPNCTGTTGTITVTSPTGTGMTYSIDGTTYTNTNGVFSNSALGTYSVTAKNSSGCISTASSVTIAQPTDTWNGTAWSTGSAPTNAQKALFTGNYSSSSNITACSCQVNSGATVVFNATNTLTSLNAVTVNSGGSLIFNDMASLVQNNDAAVNSGNITYKRKTTALKRYDYTYWSSPVIGATLSQLATNSLLYSFSPTINNWVYQTGAATMAQGVGYIGRAPGNLAYSPTEIVETSFVGVPNNGVINVPILKSTGTYNLIGNPYPSAIDADLFITTNSNSTNGTVYFWTHNTAITNLQYTSNDYAKYNLTGAVKTSTSALSGGALPTGKIGAGQGFFIEAKTSLANGTYAAVFNNSMRVSGNNTQFFKNNQAATASISEALERNRIWLSLSNSEGAYNEMLLGYVEGATDEFDSLFDGKTWPAGNSVSIYTMVGDYDLSIQGKGLPFSDTDIIPIGYNTTINGELSIDLDNFDGMFQNQDIYLLDKVNNTIHDLKNGPYTFVTGAGIVENRFELGFSTQALSIANPTQLNKEVKVISAGHQLKIVSPSATITKVEVFDILGKSVLLQNDLNTNLFETAALNIAPQVLLVKVTLDNQQTITRKTVAR